MGIGYDELEIYTIEPYKERVKAIKYLKNIKAEGLDNKHNELIITSREVITDINCLTGNIWNKDRTPETWRVGRTITIHKQGHKTYCENCRIIR